MPEWSNGTVSKTVVLARVPRVRIPASPPIYKHCMKTFYKLLANALIAVTTNNYIWFAVVFWAYLETKSVLATSIIGGIFLINMALSGFWLGSIVDRYKKKHAMVLSSVATLILFSAGFLVYLAAPDGAFTYVSSVWLWATILLLMFGVTAGNIRGIALSTSVTFLVEEDRRDKANGMIGTVMGISFGITSVASGLVLGFAGMFWVIVSALVFTGLALLHLAFIDVPEKEIVHAEGEEPKKLDIKGTIAAISAIPGLFALIFFTTFNNFLGGVYMSLMDAYGLSLVSVQVWGTIFGFLSMGFIFGGLYIAKNGLGKNPLRTLFRINIVMWVVTIFFTIQPSIILLASGMLIWMCLVPFIEATEQTIIQKVVPLERQGRVFGFAQSVEQAASPITAFLIGPIAHYIFIPYMTTGDGVRLIGSWFGTGTGRGIALVFITVGIIGLIVTLIAMRSKAYKLLGAKYREA